MDRDRRCRVRARGGRRRARRAALRRVRHRACRQPEPLRRRACLAADELQVDAGQRTAGSPQLRRLARQLRPLLPHGRFEPLPGRGLRNVVGTLPGTKPGIVLGAHYDMLAKPRGFVGANNGAAGSAIVIEAARALARMTAPASARELRFVLFDGEEPAAACPRRRPTSTRSACAARAPTSPPSRPDHDDDPARLRRQPGPAAAARGDLHAGALDASCARRRARPARLGLPRARPARRSPTTTRPSCAPESRPST